MKFYIWLKIVASKPHSSFDLFKKVRERSWRKI